MDFVKLPSGKLINLTNVKFVEKTGPLSVTIFFTDNSSVRIEAEDAERLLKHLHDIAFVL